MSNIACTCFVSIDFYLKNKKTEAFSQIIKGRISHFAYYEAQSCINRQYYSWITSK